MIKKWCGFNERALRPNQIATMNGTTIKRDGRAFVFLYVRIKADRKKGIARVCKLVIFDWKKHRNKLKGKGYGVAELRAQKVGVWLDPIKDKNGKLLWPLKRLLSI